MILNIQKYFEERVVKFKSDLHNKSSFSTSSIAEEFTAIKAFVLQLYHSSSLMSVRWMTQIFASASGATEWVDKHPAKNPDLFLSWLTAIQCDTKFASLRQN